MAWASCHSPGMTRPCGGGGGVVVEWNAAAQRANFPVPISSNSPLRLLLTHWGSGGLEL